MIRLRKLSALALPLALLPLTSSALQRTDLLPAANTYVRVTQAEQLWKELDDAFGSRLRTDEKVQDFVEAFVEKLKKKRADGKIGVESHQLFEILKLLKGEIAFVYDNQKNSALKSQPLYLAATVSDLQFQEIMKRTDWQQAQTKDEVFRKRESFQGTEIVHDIMHGGSTNETSYWMAETHGTLLLGNDREWLKKNIIRLGKETVVEPEESKLSCRMPVGQWNRNKLAEKTGVERVQSEALWTALGWLELEQYLLEIEMQDGKLVVDSNVSIGDLSQGLFSLLNTAPADFSTDRVIPPHATSFSYGKLDVRGLWMKLPEILGALPPEQSAPILAIIPFFQQQSGLDIEHDILSHIGTRFTLHTEQVSTNQPMLISLELEDGNALAQSLSRLFAAPIAKGWVNYMKISEYRGHTIYQIKPKDPGGEPPTLCVAGNHLIYGSNAVILRETILRLESDRKRPLSALQENARAFTPGNAFGYGAMDHREALSLMYIEMSDNSFSAGLGIRTNLAKGKEKEELGDNEISLNHLMSFLQNTYHYMETVPGGLHHRIIFETDQPLGAL